MKSLELALLVCTSRSMTSKERRKISDWRCIDNDTAEKPRAGGAGNPALDITEHTSVL